MANNSSTPSSGGWDEYERMVSKELERLNDNSEAIRAELSNLRLEVVALRSVETNMVEIKEWKREVEQVASPKTLSDLIQTVQDLKKFQTIVTTIWTVLYAIAGYVIFK